MNLKDAFHSMKNMKKKGTHTPLTTSWGEVLSPDDVLSEYPRPQLVRHNWQNLNGWWNYAFTPDKKYPSAMPQTILVPFSPEAPLSTVSKTLQPDEFLWYEKTIAFTPADMVYMQTGQRLILHFQAVDQIAFLWCNQKYVGRHRGGYLPFSFDVTDFVKDDLLKITLRVEDTTDTSYDSRGKQTLTPGGMFYTPQSGIWQTVWTEWVPSTYIKDIRITPCFDQAQVSIEVRLNRADIIPEISVSIYDEDLLLTQQKDSVTKFLLPLNDFHSWSPEHPFLYQLKIQTGEDSISSYFAMRKFSVEQDDSGIPRLFLNNQPYFQKGILDQGYWPDGLYTAPSDEALIYDITAMKSLGFNMIRKHIKIESLRWYYHCDRLGMLVWQDMVNGGGRSYLTFLCYLPTALPFVTTHFKDNHYRLFSRTDMKGKKLYVRECKATIDLLYNSPSICTWVPFNEGWGQFDAKKITDYIRGLDSTRFIDHASGWYDQKAGDVKSVHNYFRTLKVARDKRPFVISEYGGLVYRMEGHCFSSQTYGYGKCQTREGFIRKFQELQQQVDNLEKVGLCAVVYTQLSDVEEETNGLLTYDRKKCKLSIGKC